MRDSIRRNYINKRNRLDEAFIEASSKSFLDVFRNSILDKYSVIMSYMPIKNEAPVNRINNYILETGRTLLVPSTDERNSITPLEIRDFNDLTAGKYNIPEPKVRIKTDPGLIELVLVPGVSFDAAGSRIGYGKGCYDRFLSETAAEKAGICYEFQIFGGELPSEAHDISMDYLLTEKRLYEVNDVI